MKKIGVWSSTNPGGRKTKTVLQKHRVKALDHGWRLKCVETKTEALCPPRSRAKYDDPNHAENKWPTH